MRIRTVSLSIVAAALVAVGCSSDAEPTAESTPEPTEAPVAQSAVEAAPASERATVSIQGFAFSAVDPVAPGTEITVANLDGTQHTLTAHDGSFNTGGLDGGASIAIIAPDEPGTYTFVCNIHPSMTGTLIVEG